MSVDKKPFGYEWRSSRFLIVSSITIALFSETFLYGFLVPILSYMLEDRLHIDPSQTQNLTTALLTVHGFFTLISAPIVAHFADKSPNRKTPLLIGLAGCFAGTLLIALTPSLWLLFVGRILQAIAGSAAWVVGFGLLVDTIGKEDVGKMLGIAMSFVTAGIVGGPMASGILLELVGYWPAWSVPLGVLILDIIARLVMIEPQDAKVTPSAYTNTDSSTPEETTGLLPAASNANANANADKKSFYRIMLCDLRVLTGLANVVVNSSIMAGFNTTLPIHLRESFGWGSMPTSMMFFCLQLPSIFFSGLLGAVRDKVGLRIPTTIGWIFSAPLLWLLGICGDERFPWAGADAAGKPLFTTCIIGFGAFSMLVRSVGPVQLTLVLKEMQAKDPQIFGANGGSSRLFSMSEIAYSLGMMLGPLLTGLLFQAIGYYYMSVVLAMLCLVLCVASFWYLDGRPQLKIPESAA